jgi:predicted GNAT superfamily acetyltransferase
LSPEDGSPPDRVAVGEAEGMAELREVSGLLEAVWGRNDEGVPIGSEVLRALVHAGGCVTVARDERGDLVGAAVLALAEGASAYSMIAAAAPGAADRGIGRALKLRQREWCLERSHRSMVWTFDPLVSRNARFNLVTLGATAGEYEPAFYGVMSDELNGVDESDRLVARWDLDSPRAATAAAGRQRSADPSREGAEVLMDGPDGAPMVLEAEADGTTVRWCRVPTDVVALRRQRPEEASQWRSAVRETMVPAFADGLVASYVTRDGWYLLAPPAGDQRDVRRVGSSCSSNIRLLA